MIPVQRILDVYALLLVLDESVLDILMAPLLSAKMSIESRLLCDSVSLNILLSQMASLTGDERAVYSASDED